MITTIYKTFTFSCAHLLKEHPKCGKLHGHNYKVEIWLTGEPEGKWNFVYDFGEFDEEMRHLDHSGEICEDSAEILARDMAENFKKLSNVHKVKVRIWETDNACAEVEL